MPTLDWIGKGAVINHHREVPYHLLRCNGGLSAGNADAGNLLVQGDNLLALKALLPYYAGRVKCIYIDPPYNTGSEKWAYNDNVNSPTIRKWLGKIVGGEAEDLCRHDKWLCMMYPRLYLLRRFLAEDGVIFISIDDNEQHRLRVMMDEIFGSGNFVANIIWQKKYAPANDAKYFSDNHDFIVCYAKIKSHNGNSQGGWRRRLLPRTEKQDGLYKYDDGDGRGPWRTDNLTVKSYSSEYDYPITNQETGEVFNPPEGRCWLTNQGKMQLWIKERRVFFGRDGKGAPQLKRYLREVQQGVVPLTVWLYDEVGHTDAARKLLKNIFSDRQLPFDNPKSVPLVKKLLQVACDKDALVLDSFVGSGTTAQAILELNKEDGGNRKFICVEMDNNICRNITAERIARVIDGYKANGKGERVEGLGGGFRFCTLGAPLFNAEGKIGGEVKFSDLAAHIFFCETGSPIPRRAASPLIGVYNGEAIYLLFNGILGDKRVDGGNVLTSKTLVQLPPHSGHKIVYGEGCRISESRLRREKITFRQLPYDIQTT